MSQAAVIHCIRMLDYLAGRPAGSTVDEAADYLHVSPARARTLLGTLTERGYVKVGRDAERYALTMELTKLGLAYQAHSGTSEIFQAVLDRLAMATGELVRMALADGERLVWVAKAQGSRSGLRFDAEQTGRDVALSSTAAGKAWLASLPEARARKLVRAQGFAPKNQFGPRAIRTTKRLVRELKTTAKQGYAVGHDEYMLGISAIAAAIHGPSADEPPMGVVSIAGPLTRFTPDKLKSFRAPLLEATRELSALLPLVRESATDLLRRTAA